MKVENMTKISRSKGGKMGAEIQFLLQFGHSLFDRTITRPFVSTSDVFMPPTSKKLTKWGGGILVWVCPCSQSVSQSVCLSVYLSVCL